MDHRAAELADALECRREVGDREVGKRRGIPGTGSALVHSQTEAVGFGLPPGSGRGGPGREVDAKHSKPEAAGTTGVVSRELDQRRGHEPQYGPSSLGFASPRARNARTTAGVLDVIPHSCSAPGSLPSPTMGTDSPAAPHTQAIEAQAQELSALARDLAEQTERGRRLADDLVARLGDSGLLRAGAPAEVGGLELAPGLALRCAEEVARGDASAGWCVSIAITSSLLAAYLPDESRAELFGDGQGVAAGVWAPRGKARPVDGGVAVSGRWAFCSGIAHSDMLFARLHGRGRLGTECGGDPQAAAGDPRHLAHARPARHGQPRCRGPRRGRARQPRVLAVRRAAHRPPAVPLPDLRVLRAVDRCGRIGQRARGSRRPRHAGCGQGRAGLDAHARRARAHPDGCRRRRGHAARRAGAVLRGRRRGVGGDAPRSAGVGRPAQPGAARGHARRPGVRRCRAVDVRPRWRLGDL